MPPARRPPAPAPAAIPNRESALVQAVRRSLAEVGGLTAGPVLVGYSGGADSLTLLAALVDLSRGGRFAVHAIHVDHGARPGSAGDAGLATSMCDRLGVPIEVVRVDPAAIVPHAGVGREEAMRRERYRAFARSASARAGSVVALAHHQRDQAETVLLHLLRGAGSRGAGGMRRVATMTVPWWEEPGAETTTLRVWRPLLDVPAAEVRDFAESLGLPIASDPTNADESYRRNAVRHSVLPLLEQVAAGATGNLARFARLAADDSDYLDAAAAAALDELAREGGIDRRGLLARARPIQRRVVRAWIAQRAGTALEVPLERVDEVLAVASAPGPARRVEIGGGVIVVVTRDMLQVSPGTSSR